MRDNVSEDDRQICIVLDTNVWLSDHLLRSRLGASLVHAVVQLKAAIGLPEVVERELKPRWTDRVREELKRVRGLERTLLAMAGRGDEPSSLPSEKELLDVHDKRLHELDMLLVRWPATKGGMRRSIDRMVAHLPPSSANRDEFRDNMVWEAVLELADAYDVHFIANDREFFAEPDPTKGAALAPNLEEERKKAPGRIFCYRNIGACLTALQQEAKPMTMNEAELAVAMAPSVREKLEKQVSEAGFAFGDLSEWSVKSYLIAKPAYALTFELTFQLTSTRSADIQNPRIVVTGKCTLDAITKIVSELETETEEIRWDDAEGKPHRARPRPHTPWRDAYLSWSGNNGYARASQLYNLTRMGTPATLTGLVSPFPFNPFASSVQWEEY
jgi:hypothetical protein